MARKPDRLEPLISAHVRFLWGLILIVATMFTPRWESRTAIAVVAAVLAHYAGKRIQFAYFLFFIATITFFYLFLPFGKVLWQIGPFALTEGALFDGIQKGVTLTGLVFVSLFSVSRNLQFPGKFGGLWAQTFTYYEQLLETRKRIYPRAILLSVDRILEHLYPSRRSNPSESNVPSQPKASPKTTWGGWILVISTSAMAIASVGLR